jgi:hypothetical protein
MLASFLKAFQSEGAIDRLINTVTCLARNRPFGGIVRDQ